VCRRIYIVRSVPLLTRYIADHINAERSAGITQRLCRILFVPRKVCVVIITAIILELFSAAELVETV